MKGLPVRVTFAGWGPSCGRVIRTEEDGRLVVEFADGHVQDFEPDQVEYENVIESLATLDSE